MNEKIEHIDPKDALNQAEDVIKSVAPEGKTLVDSVLKETYPYDQGPNRAKALTTVTNVLSQLLMARQNSPMEKRDD